MATPIPGAVWLITAIIGIIARHAAADKWLPLSHSITFSFQFTVYIYTFRPFKLKNTHLERDNQEDLTRNTGKTLETDCNTDSKCY